MCKSNCSRLVLLVFLLSLVSVPQAAATFQADLELTVQKMDSDRIEIKEVNKAFDHILAIDLVSQGVSIVNEEFRIPQGSFNGVAEIVLKRNYPTDTPWVFIITNRDNEKIQVKLTLQEKNEILASRQVYLKIPAEPVETPVRPAGSGLSGDDTAAADSGAQGEHQDTAIPGQTGADTTENPDGTQRGKDTASGQEQAGKGKGIIFGLDLISLVIIFLVLLLIALVVVFLLWLQKQKQERINEGQRQRKPNAHGSTRSVDQPVRSVDVKIQSFVNDELSEMAGNFEKIIGDMKNTMQKTESQLTARISQLESDLGKLINKQAMSEKARQDQEVNNLLDLRRKFEMRQQELESNGGKLGSFLGAIKTASSTAIPDNLMDLRIGAKKIYDELLSKASSNGVNQYATALQDISSALDILRKAEQDMRGSSQPTQTAARAMQAVGTHKSKYLDNPLPELNSGAVDVAVVQQLLKKFLDEMNLAFRKVAEKRVPYTHMKTLSALMKKLGYELIEIQAGKTYYDPRLHEIVTSKYDPKYQPETIISVSGMGYIRSNDKKVFKAQVIVNQMN